MGYDKETFTGLMRE